MRADHWRFRWFGLDREFAALDTDKQREWVWTRASVASDRGWGRKILVISVSCAVALALLFSAWLILGFIERHAGYNSIVRVLVTMLLPCMFGGWIVSLFMHRSRFQHCVREEIRALQIPLCQHCGYNLTAHIDSRCPECGTPSVPLPPIPPNDDGTLCPCPRCKAQRSMQPG